MITATLFVGLVVAARAGLDWVLGELTAAQWDAWRNWLATAGGLIALIVATRTYSLNSRTKREEQPRMVYSAVREIATFGKTETFRLLGLSAKHGVVVSGAVAVKGSARDLFATAPALRVTVGVINKSKEVIGPIQVDLYARESGSLIGRSDPILALDPESEKHFSFVYEDPEPSGLMAVGTSLTFRDSAGQTWRRRSSDPIERVKE
jgi:hypothetical protein